MNTNNKQNKKDKKPDTTEIAINTTSIFKNKHIKEKTVINTLPTNSNITNLIFTIRKNKNMGNENIKRKITPKAPNDSPPVLKNIICSMVKL